MPLVLVTIKLPLLSVLNPYISAALAATLVKAEPSKANDVALTRPDAALNVKLDPVFSGLLPVASLANIGKQVVSELSSTSVAVVATISKSI